MFCAAFRAMGSGISVTGPRLRGSHGIRVQRWFASWEQHFSRFRPSSELSRLNRRPGLPVRVSTDLFGLMAVARQSARLSGGLVSPAVLPALVAAGYDRSFDRLPAIVRLRPAQPVGDWRSIRLDRAQRTVTLDDGVRIDLGGFAKGWAADRAAHQLPGAVLVDAGGDIAVSGPLSSGRWPVGIADPCRPDHDLLVVGIEAGGIATSGRDLRHWRQAGILRHHVIDPRTGQPAETDVLTATVIGPSAAVAEVAAKIVFLLGAAAGIRWLDDRNLAGLAVLDDGTVRESATLADYRWK